ncbi:hypothetical protein HMPREF1538_00218 [Fusobacterium nucleatum CTI-1]|nr:hypothetical protein HMPREF1538_00218 [Fusobacterium nucleatum CTI-1]
MLNKSVIILFGINLYSMDILLIITILLYASVALRNGYIQQKRLSLLE